jgi:truncated hemoglobin YjbI
VNTRPGTRGNWGTIEFAARDDGESRTWEEFSSLGRIEKASLHSTMSLLASTGRVANEQRFKKVEGTDLWELKKNQHRFLGRFLPGKRFIVAAYERKKRGRLQPETIERAEAVLNELMQKEETEICVKPRA